MVYSFRYNGKELDSKNGLNWYDYGTRHYDATLGRWHVVDPLGEFTISTSSYTYCHNNPINLVDPTGCLASTHTDSLGTVVAVYNDGDLGVYRHNSDEEGTKRILEKEYSSSNTSGGGEKMGETLEWNSFVTYEKEGKKVVAKILFGEYSARDMINKNLNLIQSFTMKNNEIFKLVFYAFNARNGKPFDIKHKNPYIGSQISEGKYVSMRDAGNYLAGRVANLNGLPAEITYTLFGAYNLGKNNIMEMPRYILLANKLGSVNSYGELPISHIFQKRGYELNIK